MFADDFTGVAATAAGLQTIVNICERWCAKWRMSANIGPKKSAFMIFAPEATSKKDKGVRVQWRGTPIPRVEAYRYLGVMLHENCRWDCHLAHAREKGAKATYAMASVLHNRRIHLAVRRIVLQACVRPVVEYASTVWHGTQADMKRLEQVQYRVLKRMAATHENVAAALLNMEFGCRTYESWAMQRKLEFQFRLSRMPGNRLPAMVSRCKWNGLTGAKKPGMHAAQVQRISELVNLNPSQQATDPEISYAMFKKRAAMAVRRSDLCKLTSCSKSTVRKYLQAHSHMDVFPNKMQPYLDGTMSAGMRTKLLFKAGFAPVQHLHARKHETAAGDQSDPSCPFCTCSDETAAHFALECPQFTEYRTAMREALGEQVGEHAFAEWDALQADEKLAALLNDHRWGKAATGVDYIAQHYLSDIVRERVARLPTTHCTHPAGTAGARAHGSTCYG
jgi:hypothetical protein